MQMNAKTLWAVILSFGIYLFPIPAIHTTLTWGTTLWELWHSPLATPLEMIFLTLFAILYQCVVIYCLFRLLMLGHSKILLLSLPLIILLYVILVMGQYAFAFFIFSIEKMLGHLPV